MTRPRFLLLAMIVIAAVCVRLIPYVLGALGLTDVKLFAGFLWNFSPIMALFLFAGTRFPERRWAYGAPLAAMLFSDVAIGLFLGDMKMGLHPMIPVIYGLYALIIWSGMWLRKLQRRQDENNRETQGRSLGQRIVTGLLSLAVVAGTGIAGELAFFIVTNFGTWVVQTGYYPHTLDGLMQCYLAGIPYFKNALASTPLYCVALCGGSALAEALFPALKQSSVEIAQNEQALLA